MGIGVLSSHWKADGVAIYEPAAEIKTLRSSISSADSGRTEDGYMHKTWVRRDVLKISMTWKALTGNELSTLIGQIQGKDFDLTYREFGQDHTTNVYVSEVNYSCKSLKLFASEGGLYVDISANAIEN